jgi:hypothetical protein
MQNITLLSIILVLALSPVLVLSQNTQNIRGNVIDEFTKLPLPGASIIITGTNPVVGTTTDANGKFKIEGQNPGRYTLKVSYIGYQDRYITNLELFAGKELVIVAELEEKVTQMKEVVISASIDKTRPSNDMATVSARTFSVEETNRYAGSLGDPSRMAQNFAGVMSAGDSRNDIIIRGNSPMGLLWRMEGINIPNPNHFGASGTTGGPVTMLNNNLLRNSDFFTGAFPAEYGNALSGVFDLKMRSGNNENYEFVGQIGFNGFELGAEGPFSKKKNASFLVNYRYSTLAVFDALGLNSIVGSSVPQYQDVNFKIDIPTKKMGHWTMFGIGGTSFIQIWDSKKKDDEASYGLAGTDTDFGSDMGVIGLSNVYYFNKKTRLKTNISISGTRATTALDSLKGKNKIKSQYFRSSNQESNFSFSSSLNHKFSAKDMIVAGLIIDNYHVNYIDSVYRNQTNDYFKLTDTKGSTELYQAFIQEKHKFNNKLLINGGIHFQYFGLNGSSAIEPRAGVEWKVGKGKTVSFGYGFQSQTQPKLIYFVRTEMPDGSIEETNKDLGFTQSNQFVASYQQIFGLNFRFKTEAYYQALQNAPISKSSPNYSVLNEGAYFYITQMDSLVNKGSGSNYGVEFTFEKFLSKHYYFLSTVSLFRSLYKGYNEIQHPTAFDNRFVINVLGGYEIPIKTNKLNLDLKGVYAGGKPYTPIDVTASEQQNAPVYLNDKAFSEKHPNYFRIDLRISYRMNMGKTDQEFALDIQNITNHQNVFQQVWDPINKELKTDYQQGLFPMFLFRIYF